MSSESLYCGQQLRKLRKKRDLTQMDLEVESGITYNRISAYEREGFPATIKKKDIDALCKALGCEPADLEKPILENIYNLGLGVVQDLLLDPITDGKQHVALIKYLESQRTIQPNKGDTEQKDLTQIFNIGVPNEE